MASSRKKKKKTKLKRSEKKAVDSLKGVSVKQRRFLKEYLKDGNASKAAILAGYKHRQSGDENLTKPVIQQALQQLMDQEGITDKFLLKVLKEGLTAKKAEVAKYEGEICDVRYFHDYSVRHKYMETGFKLKDKLETAVVQQQINEPFIFMLPEEANKENEVATPA